ncbi:hypothetical protein GTW51_01980 [Aurantimonas aggregata]|uniref:Energy transducer TonB n=1 Tax=Aurantimonas aggregata TaxID=2047720 RepID=A0A6L9MD53_9HYPH|nr:hypothetical protein [Aurantimonas aggregata]NDV85462.1 hypothetical protein [Aurantimonas aggregata]
MTSSPLWKSILLAAVLGFAATAGHAQQPVPSIETQVMRCWTAPSAQAATSVRPITFTLHLDPEGNLLEATTDYEPANAVERTLRDAVVRTLRRCRSLRPPAAPYEEWRETEVTFDLVRATRAPGIVMPD